MEDEIDIEEHDVLEHPRIKDMFLGLSVKTEVEDYTEENEMELEEHYQPYISTAYEDEVNADVSGLGVSSSAALTHGALALGLEYEEGIEDLDSQGHHDRSPQKIRNKIESYQRTGEQDGGESSIIKSLLRAPAISETDDQENQAEEYPLPECSVLLEDCKSFLQTNPCFCKECQILFPTHNDVDAHKMIYHSFLVAVTKNKAVKSTSKSFDSSANGSLLCNHCNVVFPNTIALLSHTYNLLPGKFACDKCDMIFENDAACKQHKVTHYKETSKSVTVPKSTGPKYLICKVCTFHLKYSTRYNSHMKESHGIEETGVGKEVHSNLECLLCLQALNLSKKFSDNTLYNKHIVGSHFDLYRKRCTDSAKNLQFKCPKCSMFFSSNYSVRIHLAAKHGHVGTVENSKQLASFENKSTKTVIPKKFNFPQVPSSRNEMWPLSKSTLFKCGKCQIHFVSCISATVHSNQCRTKKDFFQCTQCNRSIKLQDKLYHQYQHSVSNKFKVVVVSRNILNRILCKCITCNICFDERNFITHHTKACNGETPSIHCKECKTWIYTKAMGVHKKIHTSVASKEFIIVDYVHAETSLKEVENGATGEDDSHDSEEGKVIYRNKSKARTKFVNAIRRKDKYAYFYCPTCRCNMKVNRGLHHIGKCKLRIGSVICKLCGLRFTDKGIKTHKILHQEIPKLKLKDLTFVNIQTDRVINAPFPVFKKCKDCGVNFYSALALKSHTCHDEVAKSCKYCGEKFSDAAYKLHVPYHEYTMTSKRPNLSSKTSKINEKDNELIKKYESLKQVWNILFLCEECDIVMDDYDKVVVHCQDHFCNMQSYNVTIEHCETCDLKFVAECYDKHKELHVNNYINKDSFKLIKYTHENLLQDSWMDIFSSLTREQINLILCKSIYRFTRCLRMKVVTNGPTNYMLYQCGVCQLIVASNKIEEHAQNINGICEGSRKFACSLCTLTFAYKRHRQIHEQLHQVRKLSAESFRIVQFYANKTFGATVVRKNDKKDSSNSLKFIRCQRCGKLINKHKYKMHTKNHVYYETYKAKINLKNSNSKPRQGVRKVYFNFFVCRSCNLCVSRRNFRKHVCNSNATAECSECSLTFRKKYIDSHYVYHTKHSFNSSKINVKYFENGTVLNESDNDKAGKTVQFNEEKWVGHKNIKKKALSHSKLRHTLQKGKKPTLRVILKNKFITVYQCAGCNVSLWHRENIKRHTSCIAVGYQATCEICGLVQHTSKMRAHMHLHELRQFDASNLKYSKFHPGASTSSNVRSVNTGLAHKRKPLNTFEETAVKRQRLNTSNENDVGSDDDSGTSIASKDSNVVEDGKESIATPNEKRVGKAGIEESPFEKSRLFTDFIYNRYYKCKNCKLLFVTCTGLVKHEEVCSENREAVGNREAVKINETVKCSDCGLAFHASMIEKHKLLQKCKEHLAERVILITIKQKGKCDASLHKNWLYVCAKCDLYSFSLHGMKYHFENNHQSKYALKTCTDCGITMNATIFNRHIIRYHRNKTGISELYVASVVDTNLDDALKDLPNYEDVIYVDEGLYTKDVTNDNNSDNQATILLPDNESSIIKDDSINSDSINYDNPVTYACNICQLNFINPQSLLSHYRRGVHNLRRVRCDLCGLNFTCKSLVKHTRLHHMDKKINNEIKTGVDNTAVDSVSSSFDNDSQNDTSSIDEYPTSSENKNHRDTTLKLYDKLETGNVSEENIHNENHEDKIVISNPNEKLESANYLKTTENASNIDTVNITKDNNNGASDFVTESKNVDKGDSVVENSPRSNEIKPNTISNTTNIELNKNKLYKCSQCDVYYLTADDCREHTVKHTQLDPTEYIACKICDLQFCCEYLGRHMKSHREKTFCIDDLIIAEYHFGHGDVTIDTYLAADRLKTKLVTTTTHFDTVDSTTAESS